MSVPNAVGWGPDRRTVELLDQTRLPETEARLLLRDAAEVAEAIRSLRVRGAPAIGIAAALGVAAEVARAVAYGHDDAAALDARVERAIAALAATRPTAVNLRWALDRVRRRYAAERAAGADPARVASAVREEADAILEEDRAMCRAIGAYALQLLPAERPRLLTHCNAGALATGGIGTALAAVHLLQERGGRPVVFVDETRPVLQGSRLTAWELARAGVDVTVIVDAAAASLMRAGAVDAVIVGADRIAANGDVANKIGTYGLAVLARHHGIPLYVAAPTSTLDPATASGEEIEIEERDGDEVRRGFGRLTAPADVRVYAPAFDVTPAALVTAIVTDRGVARPPFTESLARLQREERPTDVQPTTTRAEA